MKTLKNMVEWALTFAGAIAFFFFIRTYVVDARVVPTGSMIPTIQLQERVVVDRLFYKMEELERGDIIVFKAPEKTEQLKQQDLVKRLIALPGETVEVRDGYVWINDRALYEPYIATGGVTKGKFGPILVPEGHYFVMGDNRDDSSDSRTWGFLEQKLVIGRVWIRYLPFDRIGSLTKPPENYFLDSKGVSASF